MLSSAAPSASTASRPAAVTIACRPSVGRDGEGYAGYLAPGSRKNSENQKLIVVEVGRWKSDRATGRNDGKTYLCDLAARFARVLAGSFRPPHSEGAGNAGRPMRPIAACAMIVVERTRVSQVTPETPGIPRAMVYGLFRALPGDRAFLPPSSAGIASRELDASVGASGPHDFTVRLTRHSSKAHQRPPHPAPRP